MKFKTENIKDQYIDSPAILKLIISEMEEHSLRLFNQELTITRLTDSVDGESGVHSANRAADIRNEYSGEILFDPWKVNILVDIINHKFIRKDGKKTLIHHSFSGGPLHFHVQVPLLATDLLLF